MSDLPVPKYAVGQQLWYANTERVERKHDCPDCLGQHKWSLSTPAGETYEVPCQRCNDKWNFNDLVPLRYAEQTAAPKSFIVKNIEASTDRWGEGPGVSYDGRAENGLFPDEASALSASEALAMVHNAKEAKTPERIAQKHLASLTYADARFDQFKNGLWNAWYAYRDTIEKVAGYLEDKTTLNSEDTRYLRDDIKWTSQYYRKQDRPLDALVDAVASALKGDASGLEGAFNALPESLKPRPKVEAEEFL